MLPWDLQHALVWNLICWQGGGHITHQRVTSGCRALETIQRLSRCTVLSFTMPGWFRRGGCPIWGNGCLDTPRMRNTADWPHTIITCPEVDLVRPTTPPHCAVHVTCLTTANEICLSLVLYNYSGLHFNYYKSMIIWIKALLQNIMMS